MSVTGRQWIVFTVPRPISTNALYLNARRGRVKSESYKGWIEAAGWEIMRQLGPKIPHCPGSFLMDISLPPGIDIDNIKSLPDICKTMGIIVDDRHMVDLHVRQCAEGECTIRIRPEGCEWGTR